MLSLSPQLSARLLDGVLFAVPSLNVSWAIVLFFMILGMLVALSPSRRTYEIKRRRDD